MEEITISDFTNTYYREYSMYTIENRAIPSYIDGFKPVQRKLLYSILNMPKGKEIKVAELGASIASYYKHGETSAQNAVVLMAAEYNNNISLFNPEGSFGTRLVPESASPRYIFVSLSDNYDKLFYDNEVCEYKDEYEPTHYLPIVPFSLLNGISGVAVGFACNILPRNIDDVKKAMLEYLTKGKIKSEIRLKYPCYVGDIVKISDKKYQFNGKYTRIVKGKKVCYHITELPINVSREKYFNKLNDLIERKVILDFEENCKDVFDFKVFANEEQAANIDKDVLKSLYLIESETENLTTLDENGKLKVFNSVEELIQTFCDYRLKKIGEWLTYKVNELENKAKVLYLKQEYIKDVLANVIDFKKMDRKLLIQHLLSKKIVDVEVCESTVNMPSYGFTTDNVAKLENDIKAIQLEISTITQTNAKDLFITRLKNLKA